VLRAPLQVLAAAPLGDALRAVDQLGTCGNGVRAELYLADAATVVALALRGERADVVAAAGDAGALVAAGLVAAPRPFATRDGVAYWIAPLRAARDPAVAGAFVDAMFSPEGRALLAQHGFAPAPP
jgi:hypothetical protein